MPPSQVADLLPVSLRVRTALHDDAPPAAAHGAAPRICSHGDVADEPPQHHRQHGCRSPADTHSRTPSTSHQGRDPPRMSWQVDFSLFVEGTPPIIQQR